MKTDDAERILKFFADSLESGKDLAIDQGPDVIQQLILWKRWEYGLAIALLVAIAALLAGAAGWLFRTAGSLGASDAEPYKAGGIAFTAASAAVATLGLVVLFNGGLQVWLAPKVFVLEYAVNLLK